MASDQTLLAEIERDVLDGKPLADLLRKCIMLGGRSGSQDLRAWATRELRGYEDEADVPDYRRVSAQIKADATMGNSWITGQTIPLSMLPDFAQEKITNQVPMFAGVGQLESLYESARNSDKNPQLSLPGWEYIARAMDSAAADRNPFQHIHALYWVIGPSAIAGLLDDIRTTLTELITELVAAVPNDQETPTAEQATQALHVAVHGGSPQFTIAAPVTTVNATGGSNVEGVTGGQTGAAGGDLKQTANYSVTHNEAVRGWLDEYRAALPELDEGIRELAVQQIAQVTAEVEKAEPNPAVVTGLLGSLKSFAQSAIVSAGAGAGTMGLAEVVAHWPF